MSNRRVQELVKWQQDKLDCLNVVRMIRDSSRRNVITARGKKYMRNTVRRQEV